LNHLALALETGDFARTIRGAYRCGYIQMSSIWNNRLTNKLVLGVNWFGAVALLLAFPALHACVVIANFVGHLFVLGLQLVTTRFPRVIAVVWIWHQMRHSFRLTRELQEVRGSDLLAIVTEPRSPVSHRRSISPTEQAQ
jgi:hypothetical protein